tara:strand:- start:45 stop:497 length:453 start_codon:yes stop_codon:yes gene_type:complete
MPNLDMNDKKYPVPKKFRKLIGDKISGNNMTTKISRLRKKENKPKEEEELLEYLEKEYENIADSIDNKKRIQMNLGRENAFKETHTKDRKNKNVTKIGGMAKLTSSGKHTKASDQIYNNRVQYYESFDKELKNMLYLIEYMDNNNKNKIL